MTIRTLHDFSQLKRAVDGSLNRLRSLLASSIDCPHQALQDLDQLYAKLHSTSFKVLVVGEFSNGKSTFLNALLGAKILDTQTTETTATINVLKHGPTPKAVIHFWGERDGNGLEISDGSSSEVDIAQIRDFSATAKDGNEKAQRVKFIEIFYPSKYCENGVELIDTPGLNTVFVSHEVCTLEFLPNGHAGIVLLNATQFLNGEDEKYVRSFRRYMTKFMYVANRIDEMNCDDPDEPVEWYIKKHWPKKLKRVLETEKEPTIYPMNARLAELGNWQDSGMQKFVEDLETFLTSGDKAREMLRPVVNQSLEIIDREAATTEGISKGLSFSSEEFDRKVQVSVPKLERAQATKDEICRYIDERTQNISLKYDSFATDALQGFAEDVKNGILQCEGDIEELKESLPGTIKADLTQAMINIQEFANAELTTLRNEVSSRYEDLCDEIEIIKHSISISNSASLQPHSNVDLRAAGGTGSSFQDLLMTYGGSAGIGALAAVILAGPLGWIAGLLGSSVWGVFMGEKQRQRQLKGLSDHVHNELLRMMSQEIPKGRAAIAKSAATIKKTFNKGILDSIRSIEQMIRQIQKERQLSESQFTHAMEQRNQFLHALAHSRIELSAYYTTLTKEDS